VSKRIVVKVGSTLLANEETLRMRFAFMWGLLRDIADLQNQGYDVVLMSSGAVALGREILKTDDNSIATKQAASACGQPVLLHAYRSIAQEMSKDIAQVLVTMSEMESQDHFDDISNTIERLFDYPVIPIVNENDTTATKDLRVGDNDRLAAKVAEMIGAEHLVILTSIDGLYDRNPSDPDAQFIDVLDDVSQYIDGTEETNGLGSGGMKTKLQAANMAQQCNCTTHIAEGIIDAPVSSVINNTRVHTKCLPIDQTASRQELWLSNRLRVACSIIVPKQVAQSLADTKQNIVYNDIASRFGAFSRDDILHVFSEDGVELARGYAECSSDDLEHLQHMRNQFDSEYGADALIIKQDRMMLVESSQLSWDAPDIETTQSV